MPEPPYAWMGDVQTFLSTPEESLLGALTRFARETGAPQLFAWDRSLASLRNELATCMPEAAGFGLVLEFELPRSGGRRPDLIILENGTVLVVEFKNRVEAEDADLDQVRDYCRDLGQYHAGCRDRILIPILVPIGSTASARIENEVHVVPPSGLGHLVRELSRGAAGRKADGSAWVNSPYAPLPALVEAARVLFERRPLPRIRRAESARIPETVARISRAIRDDMSQGTRTLVLLTGVPGSGKTIAGLEIGHSRDLGADALFLSGNRPLVQVLQHALASKVFVQEVHAYLRDHLLRADVIPKAPIVVFDEAQRAWDRDQVLYSHKGKLVASEPELIVRIAGRSSGGFSLVALIGEGQQIHIGEEGGIELWVEALKSSRGWKVLGPPHLQEAFQKGGVPYESDVLLNLTASLRSHRAADVALWAGLLLDGKLEDAGRLALSLKEQSFPIYVTRQLEVARDYVRGRYAGDSSRRFGLLASSKFRKLTEYGVDVARSDFWYYGDWYESPPTHPKSSCRLQMAVSEFGCQGLELDMPLICWGPDLVWDGNKWEAKVRKSKRVHDPQKLRLNSYRVLLTRGRDGVVVWVPSSPGPAMNPTYDALQRAGAQPL